MQSQRDEDEAVFEGDYVDMDELIDAVKIRCEVAEPDRRRGDSPGEVEALQRKIKRLLREKDDDTDFYNGKIRQLKR